MDSAAILRSSRREAAVTAVLWIAAGAYTVGYAALFAYRRDQPELLLGIPTWVVWGVILPWVLCTLITCWYAMCGMRDEDLGEEREGEAAAHG